MSESEDLILTTLCCRCDTKVAEIKAEIVAPLTTESSWNCESVSQSPSKGSLDTKLEQTAADACGLPWSYNESMENTGYEESIGNAGYEESIENDNILWIPGSSFKTGEGKN